MPAATSKECFDALIFARGNSKLAAEAVTTAHANNDGFYSRQDPFTENALLATLVADSTILPTLQSAIQTMTMINALDAMQKLHHAFLDGVAKLEPEDTVSSYTRMMGQVRELVDQKVSTVNLNHQGEVFMNLPQDTKALLEAVLARRHARLSSSNSLVIDGSARELIAIEGSEQAVLGLGGVELDNHKQLNGLASEPHVQVVHDRNFQANTGGYSNDSITGYAHSLEGVPPTRQEDINNLLKSHEGIEAPDPETVPAWYYSVDDE